MSDAQIISLGKSVRDMTDEERTMSLHAGEALPNGGIVVASTLMLNEGGGVHRTHLALCLRPLNDYHPFVVWLVVERPEGVLAGSGEYCRTLTEAIEAYRKRGGVSP